MNEELIEKLYINGVAMSDCISEITPKNVLTYTESPDRSEDMTLDVSISNAYIPHVVIKLSKLTPNEYKKLITNINQPSFVAKYFDTELGINVTRKMYCTEYSIEKLYNKGRELKYLLGVSLEFVCYNGYGSYEDLINGTVLGG